MEYFFELFLGGLTRGSIYALIALGYTMVYGIVQLINFAHGEIYMIGAFTALIVASILSTLGWNEIAILFIASVVAVVYSMAYGYTLEKVAYKPLRHAPRLSALISASTISKTMGSFMARNMVSPVTAQTGFIHAFRIPLRQTLEIISWVLSVGRLLLLNAWAMASAA